MNMKKYIRYFLVLIAAGGVLAACKKMDENYKGFLGGGEIVYNGKAEMLQAFPGINRTELKWYIISDPKIVKAKVFWTNPAHIEGEPTFPGQRPGGADSIEISITRGMDTDSVIALISGLKEGVYTFGVFMYDANGHTSVRSEIIGEVYGAAYQTTISNRPMDSARLDTTEGKSDLYIPWYGIAQQAVKIDLEYTDISGALKTIEIGKVPHPNDVRKGLIWRDQDTILNYKEGTGFKYRTAYLPEPNAIDTFYTEYTVLGSADIGYYVPPPPPSAEENFALGKNVTFSSSSGPLTDGDRTTASGKWQPSSGERADLNVWFYVDLGESKTFNTAGLYIPKDPQKIPFFEILVTDASSVGSSTKWKRAYIQFESPEKENEITFDAVTARFVKVSIGLVAENANINVSEFELYNRP